MSVVGFSDLFTVASHPIECLSRLDGDSRLDGVITPYPLKTRYLFRCTQEVLLRHETLPHLGLLSR